MKQTFQAFSIALLGLGLTACAYQPPKDINSSFYAPPVGAQLQLNSSLTIAANEAEARIQDGKHINTYWNLDTYYANCTIELRDLANVERTIEPDTFTITGVIQDTENVMLHTPTIVASAGSGDGGPPLVDYMTIMTLHSDKQPDVTKMSCQNWNEANDGEHLSIVQIRKTLGDLFTLRLPKS